ncbi:MAG: hypothetical protein WAL22_18195 [Solirubrobacteraceae bacterium]
MRLRLTRVTFGALVLSMVIAAGGSAVQAGVPRRASRLQRRAERYVERAVLKAVNGPACAPAHRESTLPGPPPMSLRSILGVLRGPPSPLVPGARSRVIVGHQIGLYVNYVRLASVVGGIDYYVFVAKGGFPPPADVTRCLRAQRTDFGMELPSIPPALQAAAKGILARQLRAEGRFYRRPLREGVFLFGLGPHGGGGGGGADAAEIKHQGMFDSSGTKHGSVLSGVVPNGVATVTFNFPRERSKSPQTSGRPPASVTATVTNNVVVTAIPRSAENAFSSTMIWRAANGTIVKTIHHHA